MRIYNTWVGIHGQDFYALVRADSEIDAIRKLMNHVGNAADAALMTPQLAEELDIEEEVEKFENSNQTLSIYGE